MLGLIVFILGISAFEIRLMWEKKLKREIGVFVFLACITALFGCYFISNPNGASFAQMILSVLK